MEARKLSHRELCSILGQFQASPKLDDFQLVEPADRPSYKLQADGTAYVLRISEPRRPEPVAFEARLLMHLNRRGLRVPRPLRARNNPKGELLVELSSGRQASVFRGIRGRPLGVFELRPAHLEQIGKLLAKVHAETHELPSPSRGYDEQPFMDALTRLRRALGSRRLARRHAPVVERLEAELDRTAGLRLSLLPHGTICGQLSFDSVRFEPHGELGLSEFAFVRRGAYVEDVAAAALSWTWAPSATQQGGPAGAFDPHRLQALLRGYNHLGLLRPEEQAALPRLMRATAAEQTALCLARHELRSSAQRRYEDYRHHYARLCAVDSLQLPPPR